MIDTINVLLVFCFLLPFLFIVISNELLDRYTTLPREVHRKYGHILSGLLIIGSTYFLGYYEMILFSVGLMIGALGTSVLKIKTVHQITRKSFGTSLFALVTLLLVLLWYKTNPELIRYGIALLTIPDALAALIGSQFGTQLKKYKKSYLGSVVFFTGTVVVSSFFTTSLVAIFVLASVLTLIEFFSLWGTDNLTLPLVGSVLLYALMLV